MRPDEILRSYARVHAEMEGQEHVGAQALSALADGGVSAGEVLRWWVKFNNAEARESRVREIEASLRREFFALPEDRQEPTLERMRDVLEDVAEAEAAMDSFRFAMDWSRGERPTCPCRPRSKCPLLFSEIGYGEDQHPGDRTPPEELAQCPLQRPREMMLWGVAPKVRFKEWWDKRQKRPARGRLFWVDGEAKKWPVDEVEGRTVSDMMRRARRVLHSWVAREGRQSGTGEVFLLPEALDSARGDH